MFRIKLRKIRQFLVYYIKRQQIYLTFDDGPSIATEWIVNYCQENKISATFFWVGKHYETLSDSKKRIMQDIVNSKMFVVGNHGYSHAFDQNYSDFYSEISNVINDFSHNSKLLEFTNKLVRTAGLNTFQLSELSNNLRSKLRSEQYCFIGWDLEIELKNKIYLNTLYSIICKRLSHGNTFTNGKIVLLFHDLDVYNNKEDFKYFIKLIHQNRHLKFDNIESFI